MAVSNIKFYGVDKWLKKLESLDKNCEVFVGRAVCEGAKVIADAQMKALKELKTDDSESKLDKMQTSIRKIQKKGLIDSFGIAPIRDDKGFLNVKTGFDGYNEVRSTSYPNGQPNLMIARSLESGTSFMPKNPIFTRAARASKDLAEKAIENSLIKSIEELTK